MVHFTRIEAPRQRTARLRRTGIRGALSLVVAVAVAGCQDTATGIFHHLAHQEPTLDRTLANDLTVGGVTRWTHADDGDRYLVAAGKLWSRPASTRSGSAEWVPVTSTFDGASGSATLLPLVYWQPSNGSPVLLAGARFVDADAFALLHADGDRVEPASIAWTRVTDELVKGREVIGLFTPDADQAVLFAVVADARGKDRSYTLLSSVTRSGAGPEFSTEREGLDHPVDAIAADGTGAYWAVAGSKLYTGRRGNLEKSESAPTAKRFGGVLHHGSALFLSGSDGKLWRSTDGGKAWSEPTTTAQVAGQTVAFSNFAAVGNMVVLVGTDGFGYYTVTVETDGLSAERMSFTTEAFYTASIPRFWIDPDGPEEAEASTVFALTNGGGLLSAMVTPDVPPERWQQE